MKLPALFAVVVLATPCASQWPTAIEPAIEVVPGGTHFGASTLSVAEDGGVFVVTRSRLASPVGLERSSVLLARFDAGGNRTTGLPGVTVFEPADVDAALAIGTQIVDVATVGESAYVAFKGGPDSSFVSLARVDPRTTSPAWSTSLGPWLDFNPYPSPAAVNALRVVPLTGGELFVAWSADVPPDTGNGGGPEREVQFAIVEPGGTIATSGRQEILPSLSDQDGFLVDLVATSDGGAALAYWGCPKTLFFTGDEELCVVKWDAAGVPQWGSGIQLEAGGSIGHEYNSTGLLDERPRLLADGSGGVFVTWVHSGPTTMSGRDSWLNHVAANGTLLGTSSGALIADDQVVDAARLFLEPNGDVTAIWIDAQQVIGFPPTTTPWDLRWQRFSPTGTPTAPLDGAILYSLPFNEDLSGLAVVPTALGLRAFFLDGPSNSLDSTVSTLLVDPAGIVIEAPSTIDGVLEARTNLRAAGGGLGDAICLAERLVSFGTVVSVELRNVALDGGLGPVNGAIARTGAGNVDSLSGTVGPLGGVVSYAVDLARTGQPAAAIAGFASPTSAPFGVAGTLLVDVSTPALFFELVSGSPATLDLAIPNDVSFAGFLVATQAAHLGGGQPLALTNALDVYLGL